MVKSKRRIRNNRNGLALICICAGLVTSVSSFVVYRIGFNDIPPVIQNSLAGFAVLVTQGALIWLTYGFVRKFSSLAERVISLSGMIFLVNVSLINITTHFMIVRRWELFSFQQAWLSWGAVSVFIGVLVFVLLITLTDPVVRSLRAEHHRLRRAK